MSYVIVDNQLVKVESKKKKKSNIDPSTSHGTEKQDRKSTKKTASRLKGSSRASVEVSTPKKDRKGGSSSSKKKDRKRKKDGHTKATFTESSANSGNSRKKSRRSGKKMTRTLSMNPSRKKQLSRRSTGDIHLHELDSDDVRPRGGKGHTFDVEDIGTMDKSQIEISFLGKLSKLRMSTELARMVPVSVMKEYLTTPDLMENEQEELNGHLKSIEKLKKKKSINREVLLAIRTYITTIKPVWLYEFVQKDGMKNFVEFYKWILSVGDPDGVIECARILRFMLAVAEAPFNVFSLVFEVDGVTKNIVNSLGYMNDIMRADMMRVLAAVASSDRNFWRKVFDEFYLVGFDTLVDPVLESYNHNVELGTMVLINALMKGFTDEQQAFFIEVDDRLGDMAKLEESSKTVPELSVQVNEFKVMREEFSPNNKSTEQKLQEEQIELYKNRVAKQKREIQRLKNLVRDAEELIADQQAAAAIGAPIPQAILPTSNAPPEEKPKQSKIKIFGKKKKKEEPVAPPPPTPTPTPVVPPPPPVLTGPIPVPVIIPASVLPPPPPMMGGGIGLPPPPPPPPPMMGKGGKMGIPPPPGMPGNVAAKPVIKPGKKMRAYNWSKIHPSKLKGTIWEDATDEGVVVEAKVLEDFFGADPFQKKIKGQDENQVVEKKPAKPQKITLLPQKKATNVEIMLKGLKQDPLDISKSLRRLPQNAFTVDQLEAISNTLPEDAEVSALKSYTGEEDMLAPGDQYYLAIIDIPFLDIRLSSMLYQYNFEESVQEIREKLDLISGATDTLSSDPRLVSFLEVTLAVGNYLNGGTNRGGSFGFKLSSLPKLFDVRGVKESSFTLLHYIVEYIQERDKDILDYFYEFDDVHAAVKDNLDDVKTSVKKLVVGTKPIAKTLENDKCDKYFKRAFGPWITTAQEECDHLESYFLRTEEDYVSLLNRFAETGAKSNVFFSMMSKFAKLVEKCVTDNLASKERRSREKARKEKLTARRNSGPNMAAPSQDQLAAILGNMNKREE